MGTCETIITLILVVLCIASIICAIWDYDDKRGYRGISIMCACLFAFLTLIVTPTFITIYERERDYPYTKTLYVKLYYIDGGSEIKTFNCEGYEQPHMTPGKGYFWFKLDGYSIPSVSRYEIIKEDRFYKNN
jgi:hypothetical protein